MADGGSVPVVALDGSPAGLSHDGRTLVLIRPRERFPRASTRLAVFDAQGLRRLRTIVLDGDFSFDAISPDGATIYLIQYVSGGDPTKYLVRALDARTGRLHPEPVVDPDEPDEDMSGFALSRADSPDGRWAYTLYDGGGDHPFVHALDTVDRRAVCVDLPAELANGDPTQLRLTGSPGGERLTVMDGERALRQVDTRTFRVSAPVAAVVPAAATRAVARTPGRPPSSAPRCSASRSPSSARGGSRAAVYGSNKGVGVRRLRQSRESWSI